jgi:hypothetical protein
MSNLNFEEPPVEALGKDDRVAGTLGIDVGLVERQLKASPGQWAKIYGTDDVPGATKAVASRWDKKPGFETKRLVIEESKTRPDGSKRQPSSYKYNIWIRYVAPAPGAAPVQDDAPREVPIPTPAPTPRPAPVAPTPPVIHGTPTPVVTQVPDAESVPARPPAQAERYQRNQVSDPIASGMAEFD